jgi:hypothetical protein
VKWIWWALLLNVSKMKGADRTQPQRQRVQSRRISSPERASWSQVDAHCTASAPERWSSRYTAETPGITSRSALHQCGQRRAQEAKRRREQQRPAGNISAVADAVAEGARDQRRADDARHRAYGVRRALKSSDLVTWYLWKCACRDVRQVWQRDTK